MISWSGRLWTRTEQWLVDYQNNALQWWGMLWKQLEFYLYLNFAKFPKLEWQDDFDMFTIIPVKKTWAFGFLDGFLVFFKVGRSTNPVSRGVLELHPRPSKTIEIDVHVLWNSSAFDIRFNIQSSQGHAARHMACVCLQRWVAKKTKIPAELVDITCLLRTSGLR